MVSKLYSSFKFYLRTLTLSSLIASSALAEVETSWVPGQYIIKYSDQGIKELKTDPRLAVYPKEVIEEALTDILEANKVESLPLIEASTIIAQDKQELDINSTVDQINAGLIEYISPDFIRKISAVPNDPMYSSLWGMNQSNNIDINGPEAADKASFSQSEDIIVGVIDTGIDYNHPDLQNNMWKNPLELSGSPGVDDDGNGIVDDIYGYNAINNSGNPFDDNKHGTHCAGTIGAEGNNGIGVAGVVWKVKLMALKFLNSSGSGSDSGAIKAINYAVTMRNRGGKLKVLSNSWGGSGQNPALLNAINIASDAGILFVAAAGNDNKNTDSNPNYPSCYDAPNVLAVAAIDSNGSRATFSNYGANTVDIAAPGVNILSTVPGNRYESLNGTSMATPHVSGLAVLSFSQSSQLTALDVKNILMQSIKPLSSLNGLMIKAGIPDAAILASDQSNQKPDLLTIANQKINPLTRKLAVPLLAFDKDGNTLSYKAELYKPEDNTNKSTEAELDKIYGFYQFVPSSLRGYGFILYGAAGKQFFLRYDGALFELIGNNGTYITSIDVKFFQNPSLLVNAYQVIPEPEVILDLQIINSSPNRLEITARRKFTETITIIASASDGEKEDIEQFNVEMRAKEECK